MVGVGGADWEVQFTDKEYEAIAMCLTLVLIGFP